MIRSTPAAILATMLTTLLCGLSFAQNPPQEPDLLKTCLETADTQLAMNTCAGEEAIRTDDDREDLFQTLLSAASTEPGAAEKIRAAENAWGAYRDAYLEAAYPAENKRVEYGSIFPMQFSLLRAYLTDQHIAELRALLERYQAAQQ